MSAFPIQIVGFDLDGTLVDSHRDLAPALNHALLVAGRPAVAPEEVREFIGGGTAMMLSRALERTGGPLPEDEFQAALGELQEHDADGGDPAERPRLLDEAADAVFALFVQHEACDCTDHRELVARYRIPAEVMARIGSSALAR